MADPSFFFTSWSLCITYLLSSRHIHHSNPAWGKQGRGGIGQDWTELDPKGTGGFAPTWEEGITSLATSKGQVLTLTTPGPSRSRASKEFKTVWIQLQPVVSPPGSSLHLSTTVRVAAAEEVNLQTCPQEGQNGVQHQTLTPRTPPSSFRRRFPPQCQPS